MAFHRGLWLALAVAPVVLLSVDGLAVVEVAAVVGVGLLLVCIVAVAEAVVAGGRGSAYISGGCRSHPPAPLPQVRGHIPRSWKCTPLSELHVLRAMRRMSGPMLDGRAVLRVWQNKVGSRVPVVSNFLERRRLRSVVAAFVAAAAVVVAVVAAGMGASGPLVAVGCFPRRP